MTILPVVHFVGDRHGKGPAISQFYSKKLLKINKILIQSSVTIITSSFFSIPYQPEFKMHGDKN
jgi:hypothetical protein